MLEQQKLLIKQEILKPGPCASVRTRGRRRQSTGWAPRGICDPAHPHPTRAHAHTHTYTFALTHTSTPAPHASRLALPRRRNAAEPRERVCSCCLNAPRSWEPGGPVGRTGGRSATRAIKAVLEKESLNFLQDHLCCVTSQSSWIG